jgi:hypothetical protein
MFGRMMNEPIGKLHFILTFIGFNGTFFPMHLLGVAGMPRRYHSYGPDSGWGFWNAVVSFGAFFLASSLLLFVYNLGKSLRKGEPSGPNPWDAATLEWAIPSPPPPYNFARIPHITHRDPLWAEKYGPHGPHHAEAEVEATIAGKTVAHMEAPDESPAKQEAMRTAPTATATKEDVSEVGAIHLPNPSYYPLIAAFGLFLGAMGLLVDHTAVNPTIVIGLLHLPSLSALGILVLALGIYGWSFEPAG